MLIDVHVHSSHTEGVDADPREILEAAREAGLDGVCFTDRASSKNAVDLIRLGAEVGVEVFIGVELTTDHGVLVGFAPRIDAFYLEEQWRQLHKNGTPIAQQMIDLFEAVGGAVVAAYPYDMNIPWASGDRIFELKGLKGVEAFVPRLDPYRNAMAIEAAQALGVSMLAGSDFRGDLERLGEVATLFSRDIASQAELVSALRNGDCWAVAIGIQIKDPKPRPREERSDRGGRSGGRGGRDGGRGRGGRDGGRGGGRGGRDGGRGGRGGRDGGRGRRSEGGGGGERRGGGDGDKRRGGGRDGDKRRSGGGERRGGGGGGGGGGRSRRPRRD